MEPAENYENENDDVKKFEFDEDFQNTLAALSLRDVHFMQRTVNVLQGKHFSNIHNRILVTTAIEFFQKYKSVPSSAALAFELKRQIQNKRIRKESVPDLREHIKKVYTYDISGSDFYIEKVSEFSRECAVIAALRESISLAEKGEYNTIVDLMSKAVRVGGGQYTDRVNYIKGIKERTNARMERHEGILPPIGISTGYKVIDAALKHKGYGRKELFIWMGFLKSGKSMALIDAAKIISMQGYNVLFVSLENSLELIQDRLDSTVCGIPINDLEKSYAEVQQRVLDCSDNFGELELYSFPSGQFCPNQLMGIIEDHKAHGVCFDAIIIDYLDLMRSNVVTGDFIRDSKSVWVDSRAIAQMTDSAMISATQTNREGGKANVAGAEHSAEDINKARIADLVLSINSNEQEKREGIARIHWAASRNQQQGITLRVQQNLEMARFIDNVLGWC